MSKKFWTKFRDKSPPDFMYVAVMDHEDNSDVGFWDGRKLEMMTKHPVGLIMRWALLEIRPIKDIREEYAFKFYYRNGEALVLETLYSREVLFLDDHGESVHSGPESNDSTRPVGSHRPDEESSKKQHFKSSIGQIVNEYGLKEINNDRFHE